MQYKKKRLVAFNPLLESKRIFSQQKALNYLRIFIVYLGLTIYLFIKPAVHPCLVVVLVILGLLHHSGREPPSSAAVFQKTNDIFNH